MNGVTKDLLEVLRDLVDIHWLQDSHAVDFDSTVLFSPSYDFSNLRSHRRSELRVDGFECVVWPGGYPDFKWSAYSTYEGSLWFEQFDSEAEARAVCMKLLADVMPDHAVSKAVVAIARAEAALTAPQPDSDTPWRDAVIVELLVASMLDAGHGTDPSRAVKDLIAYHADIAIDPRVSEAAARLVEQARAEEREVCVTLADQLWAKGPAVVTAAIRARGEKP